MTSNTNPDGNVPLDSNGDVTLSTLLALLADEVVRAADSTALSNEYTPSSGRVAILADDSVYVGNGTAWKAVDADTGVATAVTLRRLAVQSANGTIDQQGVVVPVDTSGSTVTITLASAAVADGVQVIVNDEQGNAGTNAITVDTEGGETIDGATSQTIGSNYGELRLYSDGSNWFTW